MIPLTLDNDSLVLGKDKICKEDVFVVGNEGHGISKPIIEATNNTMIIPMQKNTESLNAAVAATIIMWELFK